MLGTLLRSLVQLDRRNLDCIFVIVENDEIPTSHDVISTFADLIENVKVVYEMESRVGISYARNRVLDIACRERADMLAFIDDDEIACEGWLHALVSAKLGRKLDLVGGPVRPHRNEGGSSLWERLVWRGLKARSCRAEAKIAQRVLREGDGHIDVNTGNWLVDISFIQRAGLRFNEALGLSGGEDTVFCAALRAAGGRSGWVDGAVIYEIQPKERLNLRYQYRRSRDRATTSFKFRYSHPPTAKVSLHTMISVVGKCVTGLYYVGRAAFDRGASLVDAAYAFGFAAGRVRALRGIESSHYQQVTGG